MKCSLVPGRVQERGPSSERDWALLVVPLPSSNTIAKMLATGLW